MKNILILGVFLTLINCNMISQDKINHKYFQELHKHQGSDNYEIVEIIPKKKEASDFIVDKISQKLYVDLFYKQPLDEPEDIEARALKLDLYGKQLDSYDINTILKDGTMWDSSYYVNWVINGDTTKHKFIDPFSNKEIDDPYEFTAKEKDPEKQFEKFKELYAKAQYIYIYSSFYYFKIDKNWYLMRYYKMSKALGLDIEKIYPKKEDQDVRMVALPDISPKYFIPPNERDTQLIREIGYESTEYEEENWGLIKQGYSAGWWYLEVYMPLGDTIKIKRFSSFRRPDLMLYKTPSAYGGRQDVLFIVQEPNPIHVFQTAGMYVIRPKDPEQPQRRYSLITYKKDKEGYKIIDKEKSEESEAYKAWVKNKINR